MDRMKTFGKYALIVVGIYVLSGILIFIGLNLNYKEIELNNELSSELTIAKAEATNKNGRIYGYVTNNQETDVNGKYIKAELFDENYNSVDIQYLQINDVKKDEKKMFKIIFNADNVKSYAINLVEE